MHAWHRTTRLPTPRPSSFTDGCAPFIPSPQLFALTSPIPPPQQHGPLLLWRAPCTTFLAHHGIHVDQSELATCPLRLSAPLGDRVSIVLPNNQEHRFQVKLAVAAYLPARCLTAIRASPFPRRLSHDLRCTLLAARLWRLQHKGEEKADGSVERSGAAGGRQRVELVKLCALVGAAGGAANGAEGGEGEEWHTLLCVVEEWIEAALVGDGARSGTGRQGAEGEVEQGGEAMEVDGEGDRGSAGRGAQGGADKGVRQSKVELGEGREETAGGEGGDEVQQSAWEQRAVRGEVREGGTGRACRWGESGARAGRVWGVGELVELLRALHGVYEESRLDALCRSSLPRLAALVWVLAAVLGAHDLCDHYQRHHPSLSLLARSFPPILSERALPPHPTLPSVVPCVFTWLARTVQYGPKHAAPWLAWMPPSLLSAAAQPMLDSAGQVAEKVGEEELGNGEGRGREASVQQGAREGEWWEEWEGEWWEEWEGEGWEEWEGEGEGGPGLLPLVVLLFSLLFPRGAWTRPAARPPSKARHKPAVREEASGGGKAGTNKGGKGGAAGGESEGERVVTAAGGDGVAGLSERCVAAMVAAHMGRSDLQRLPPAVALPLLQALHVCRENPPPGWPAAAYVLVGRDDLAATATACLHCFSLHHSPLPRCPSPHSHLSSAKEATITASAPPRTTAPPLSPHSLSPLAFSFPPTVLVRPLSPFPSSPHSALHPSLALPGSHASQGLASASGVGVGGMGAGAGSGVGVGGASDATGVGGGGAGVEGAGGEGMVADGMEHLLLPPARSLLALRFPCDLRLAEVRRLLCSARPVPLPAAAASDSTDPDALAAHQVPLTAHQVPFAAHQVPLVVKLVRSTRPPFLLALASAAWKVSCSISPPLSFLPMPIHALSVPKLVLAGRLTAQNDATLSTVLLDPSPRPPLCLTRSLLQVGLDGTLGNLSELATWPEFHNGVAAGLKLACVPVSDLTSPHLTSHHITSPHLTSPHITSHHLTSPHMTSHHLTSPHLTSHHLTSPHITSPHITSHHLTSPHRTSPRRLSLLLVCPCCCPAHVIASCHAPVPSTLALNSHSPLTPHIPFSHSIPPQLILVTSIHPHPCLSRLPPPSQPDAVTRPGTVTRAWVVYNRPGEASSAHGGLLMALGLRGHLRVLAPTDFFRDLALVGFAASPPALMEHEATTVGVLLGAAASYRATMDANICKVSDRCCHAVCKVSDRCCHAVCKMLYLHIPSRHPPSFPDLELPPSIQTAALVGVGLLHMGSAHRLTTEILL
ncbi:unnamed protein product [Closterium sp. NIES-64]|nr:unnamed protein product [Closterium sp. NIES-64]